MIVVNLKETVPADLSSYDKIIIGGSIYMGQIQQVVKEFCNNNAEVLKCKKIGLFIVGMLDDPDTIKMTLISSFTNDLVELAVVSDSFGGIFKMKKLKFMERMIVKMVSKKTAEDNNVENLYDGKTDISKLSEERINAFADKINLA